MDIDNLLIPLACTSCGAPMEVSGKQFGPNFSVRLDGDVVYYGGNSGLDEEECKYCGRKWLRPGPVRPHPEGGKEAMEKVVEAIAQTYNMTVAINGDNNTVVTTNVTVGAGGVAIGGNVKGSIVVGNISRASGVVIGNNNRVDMTFEE